MPPAIIDTVIATDHEILAGIYNFLVWYGITLHAMILMGLLFIGVKWVIPVWWYKK